MEENHEVFGMLAKNGSYSCLATYLMVTVSYITTFPHLQMHVIPVVNHVTQFVICLSCLPSLLKVYHVFLICFFDSLHCRLCTCCCFLKYRKCLYNPTHDRVA